MDIIPTPSTHCGKCGEKLRTFYVMSICTQFEIRCDNCGQLNLIPLRLEASFEIDSERYKLGEGDGN